MEFTGRSFDRSYPLITYATWHPSKPAVVCSQGPRNICALLSFIWARRPIHRPLLRNSRAAIVIVSRTSHLSSASMATLD